MKKVFYKRGELIANSPSTYSTPDDIFETDDSYFYNSFKYNRINDVGNLVARIFVNKDKHFFVEGEKQLGFLFNDFVNQKINIQTMEKIIDSSILFSLNFDLLTPNFQDINLVDVHQLLGMNNSHKLRTSKSLGFKFSFENK